MLWKYCFLYWRDNSRTISNTIIFVSTKNRFSTFAFLKNAYCLSPIAGISQARFTMYSWGYQEKKKAFLVQFFLPGILFFRLTSPTIPNNIDLHFNIENDWFSIFAFWILYLNIFLNELKIHYLKISQIV
jgi:hypothetical protein